MAGTEVIYFSRCVQLPQHQYLPTQLSVEAKAKPPPLDVKLCLASFIYATALVRRWSH
jgi:hypothetical protein